MTAASHASRASRRWSDARAEPLLAALSVLVLLVVGGMIAFVLVNAWPSFAHNGLGWFGSGGGPVDEQLGAIQRSPADPASFVYELHAWPLLYGTLLTTGLAVLFGLAFALLSAVFIVEFAPEALRRVLEPVVRLLAGVPSVIYGLIGILAIGPWVTEHLISQERKESVIFVVSLTGLNLTLATLILTIMITPIMIAIIVDALRSVPRSWTEGSAALGVNRWRTMWKISVRAARPAIIAAAVLATARALGEAIMLSMVSGSLGFAPNPLDGITFFFEPVRPLAATIVDNAEALAVQPLSDTIYAFAAVLLDLHGDAVLRGLGRQAADEEVRGPGVSAARDDASSWPVADRVGLALCWAAGLALCAIALTITLYMAVKGAQYLRLELLVSRPEVAVDQSRSGGFLDPIIGTVLLVVIGIAVALPLGVGVAVWLAEYGRPPQLARAVESGVEIIAGTPSIVLAIFGLIVFQESFFGFLSFTAEGGAVFGRSLLTAGAMMSLIAVPLVVGATREALQSIPRHVREASYALGKTKISTIRRVLLPSIRPGIATGAVLGMGRIAGDTAIVVILLGATARLDPGDGPAGVLQGTGSTLTSYVYGNSPVGEGNAPEKAYAAAAVLLLLCVALNFSVTRIAGGRRSEIAWA